ncbi:MAG: hypothetical protein IJU92_10175 [Spirochaetaceae bacterium]|nr:hypothetical protein [Spirochaetaceae bacterium]
MLRYPVTVFSVSAYLVFFLFLDMITHTFFEEITGMKKYLSYIVLVIGICLIVFGIASNEVSVVLKKAVNICLECIGIG